MSRETARVYKHDLLQVSLLDSIALYCVFGQEEFDGGVIYDFETML